VERNDPKWIQEGQNFKFLGIIQNMFHCVGLIVLIPTIYIFLKMDIVCESYSALNFFPNMQKVKGQSQLVKGRTNDMEDDVNSTS
jgi:hypothetical protein